MGPDQTLQGNFDPHILFGSELEIKSTGSDTTIKGISSEEFPLLPKIEGEVSLVLPAEAVRSLAA